MATMYRDILGLLLLLQSVLYSDCQRNLRFFRKDYTYLDLTQSFYKIHTIKENWNDAKARCEMEGATLFYPENEAEALKVIDFWTKTQTMTKVLIGVNNKLETHVYLTLDGLSLLDVYNKWAPGQPDGARDNENCLVLLRDGTLHDYSCNSQFHFICKKRLSDLEWNDECNMPGNDYILNPKEGHCYKFHTVSKNWTDALSICDAEQGYLAIVNSKEEMNYLVDLMMKTDTSNSATIEKLQAMLGFHNRDNNGWITIKGQRLEDAGYMKWGRGLPDGGTSELCGSMGYDAIVNDVPCDMLLNFICERDLTQGQEKFPGVTLEDRISNVQ